MTTAITRDNQHHLALSSPGNSKTQSLRCIIALALLFITLPPCFAYGHTTGNESASTGSHSFFTAPLPGMAASDPALIKARLQLLFGVDSALAHTYMSHVVVHGDAVMATDSLPALIFCTSGRFDSTSIALAYSELVNSSLADSINAITGQNLLLLTMADYFDNDTYLPEKHTADIEEVFRQAGLPVSAPILSHEKQVLSIYPNPTRDNVSIKAGFAFGTPCTVQVISLAGQVVFIRQIVYQDGITLPVYELSTGTYVVSLSGDGQVYSGRLFLVK